MAELFHELDDAQLAHMRGMKFGDWDYFEFEKIKGTQAKLDYLYQCIQDTAADKEFYLRELRKAEQLPEIREFDEAIRKFDSISTRIEEITTKFADIFPDGVWHDWVFTVPFNEHPDPELAKVAYEETEFGFIHDGNEREWKLLKAEAEELKRLYEMRDYYGDIASDPPYSDGPDSDGYIHEEALKNWNRENKLLNDLKQKYLELIPLYEAEQAAEKSLPTNATVETPQPNANLPNAQLPNNTMGFFKVTLNEDGKPADTNNSLVTGDVKEKNIDHVAAASDMWEAQRKMDIEAQVERAKKPEYLQKLKQTNWNEKHRDEVNLGRIALNKNLELNALIGVKQKLIIKNKHAKQMLAFRGGVAINGLNIYVQFTSREDLDSNRVEVRFLDGNERPIGLKSLVTIEIEKHDKNQKWKVSTCLSTNPNWPFYENNVDGVPSGISQILNDGKEVDASLKQLVEYHRLIVKEMTDNNHG